MGSPGEAAMVDNVVVESENSVRQPVVAHELSNVLDRVELRWSEPKLEEEPAPSMAALCHIDA